jgi:hypothetical protein
MTDAKAICLQPPPGGVEVREGGLIAIQAVGASAHDPIRDGGGPHLDLLDVDSCEAAAAFVALHGPLLRHDISARTVEVVERFEEWGPLIGRLRHAMRVWRAGLAMYAGDHGPAEGIIRVEDSSVMVADAGGAWSEVVRFSGRTDSGCGSVACVGARRWAGTALTRELTGHGEAYLDDVNRGGRCGGWQYVILSGWGAACWTAGLEVAGHATFRRCASCRRWLRESKSMGPDVGVTTCSGACRQRLHRQRKAV